MESVEVVEVEVEVVEVEVDELVELVVLSGALVDVVDPDTVEPMFSVVSGLVVDVVLDPSAVVDAAVVVVVVVVLSVEVVVLSRRQ